MATAHSKNLLDWVKKSGSAFDVVVCKQADLPSDLKVLDADVLNRQWQAAFTDLVGATPLHKAQHRLQFVAHRIVRQLAKRKSADVDVSVNGLRNAWFYPVFSELTTLVPLRHLARKMATQNSDQPIAIPLATQSFVVLNGWSRNFLEPLYLAFELRRRKVPVVLFSEDLEHSELQFDLSKDWLPKGFPEFRRNKDFTVLMSRRAMRERSYARRLSGTHYHQKPSLLSRERYFGIDADPSKLTVKLHEGQPFGDIRTFSASSDILTLDQGFIHFMAPLTRKLTAWYRREFKGRSIKEVHIADHSSFEGGLLGAEVVRGGGTIYLWPHSANVVHMHVHDPDDVTQVSVAARSTAAHWVQSFGPQKVKVDLRSVLPETSDGPEFDENHPLHVVLFAGAHALNRMPLVDYRRHQDTWVAVLKALSEADISYTIKHKSVWETRKWISALTPHGIDLPFSRTKANKLKRPNMLFMSISHTSTALFEGIARGIPGVTVRDVPIEETPYYDPEFVPCLPSDELAEFLASLNNKAAMDQLREKQRVWFERETSPDPPFQKTPD